MFSVVGFEWTSHPDIARQLGMSAVDIAIYATAITADAACLTVL